MFATLKVASGVTSEGALVGALVRTVGALVLMGALVGALVLIGDLVGAFVLMGDLVGAFVLMGALVGAEVGALVLTT